MVSYEGIRLADATDAERTAVEAVLTETEELPVDSECAMRAGAIDAELASAGNPVDETDVVIAATGLVDDYPVVARTVDHFERTEVLDVVSY